MVDTANLSVTARHCRLCGAKKAVLTLEHVPPQSTGNRGRMLVEHLVLDGNKARTVKTEMRDGVALRVLCESCNTRFGSSLGTGFGDFAKQVRASGRLESPGGGIFVSALDIFPGRVARQLLLSFLCLQPADDEGRYDELRKFIKSRDGGPPGSAPRIEIYFNVSSTYRVVPTCSIGSLGKGKNWAGSEVAIPNLGVLFSLNGSETLPWFIGKVPVDITEWASRSFGHREPVALRLPRLSVNHPHPLGFGSAKEVDRWQARKHIMWLVAKADDPNSLASVAALWRPSRS